MYKYVRKELQQWKERSDKVVQRGGICIFMKEITKLQLSQERSRS